MLAAPGPTPRSVAVDTAASHARAGRAARVVAALVGLVLVEAIVGAACSLLAPGVPCKSDADCAPNVCAARGVCAIDDGGGALDATSDARVVFGFAAVLIRRGLPPAICRRAVPPPSIR